MEHPAAVPIESGLVEGLPGRDRSVTVYRGIPYAAAPVGPLRWRPPQPPLPWEGVRRAHRFGPMCPQAPNPEIAGTDLPMHEDCLRLNAWSGAREAGERRPVLVWIYGGGFRAGSGSSARYDGENLARSGLVVVTFDYRLGALGFLATPELSAEDDRQVSGNYGLLDCIAALQWVQRNIAGFGGDPDRVTIAGQSAGAGACNFLAMSPLARGLFQRVIAQSHARYSRDPELRYLSTSYRTLPEAEAAGARFAEQRGARTTQLLRALPWHKLISGDDAGDTAVETGSTAKPPLFRPVVDGWAVPAGYEQTYAKGLQNEVCYLAGNNLDESGAVPEESFASIRADRRHTRPGMPPTHVTVYDFRAAAERKFGPMAEEFLRLYPAAADDEAARASNDAIRDNARISTWLWAQDWSKHCDRSLYTYFWTHRAPGRGSAPRRAAHSSEIDFVFGNHDPLQAAWSERDRQVAETMAGYWANFAATGDPNGPGLPAWPRYTAEAGAVMELGGGLSGAFQPIPVAEAPRIDFWKRFFDTQSAW
ncbi:MAG TPA: carboxylesterase family protein [Actinocrinis sp.]|jgi:carboxylesterase type B